MTVPTPAKSTMTSNVTGTKAGKEFHGRPPTLVGQLITLAQYWNARNDAAPNNPSTNVTRGNRECARPIAAASP